MTDPHDHPEFPDPDEFESYDDRDSTEVEATELADQPEVPDPEDDAEGCV
jgi:hypothetical protein